MSVVRVMRVMSVWSIVIVMSVLSGVHVSGVSVMRSMSVVFLFPISAKVGGLGL